MNVHAETSCTCQQGSQEVVPPGPFDSSTVSTWIGWGYFDLGLAHSCQVSSINSAQNNTGEPLQRTDRTVQALCLLVTSVPEQDDAGLTVAL